MKLRWDKCVHLSDSQIDYVQEAADLKEFRSFKWMLTPEMEVKLAAWDTHALETSKDRLQNQRAAALKDIEQEGATKKSLSQFKTQ